MIFLWKLCITQKSVLLTLVEELNTDTHVRTHANTLHSQTHNLAKTEIAHLDVSLVSLFKLSDFCYCIKHEHIDINLFRTSYYVYKYFNYSYSILHNIYLKLDSFVVNYAVEEICSIFFRSIFKKQKRYKDISCIRVIFIKLEFFCLTLLNTFEYIWILNCILFSS